MMPSRLWLQRISLSLALLACLSVWRAAIPADAAPATASAASAAAASAAAASGASLLQQLMAGAKSGGTVSIPAGIYEGPIVIERPLRLVGDGAVTIRSGGDAPTVTVAAAGASLQGLTILHETEDKSAAVSVTSDDVVIDSLDIRTRGYGILLRKVDRVSISGTHIQWLEEGEAQAKGKKPVKRNGIDLFDAHRNVIDGNVISGMNDGIYLESSNGNVVSGNAVDHSRYGVHCMFTKHTVVRNNHGNANVTGAMIMGVDDAVVTGNAFTKQSENVNSQGLLLFDVHTSRIENNLVEGNRVGLYVEQSSGNQLRHNRVLRNFTGIQLLDSEDNLFTANDFIGNVIESEASDSRNNRLEGNYWDAYRGIDTNGDGASDTKYAMNPFFEQLTRETPAYQLFFRSPGMIFLESLFETNRDSWSYDAMPRMRPVVDEGRGAGHSGRSGGLLASGSALLLGSVCMMLVFGGRRR